MSEVDVLWKDGLQLCRRKLKKNKGHVVPPVVRWSPYNSTVLSPLPSVCSDKFACQAMYSLSECSVDKVLGHPASPGELISTGFSLNQLPTKFFMASQQSSSVQPLPECSLKELNRQLFCGLIVTRILSKSSVFWHIYKFTTWILGKVWNHLSFCSLKSVIITTKFHFWTSLDSRCYRDTPPGKYFPCNITWVEKPYWGKMLCDLLDSFLNTSLIAHDSSTSAKWLCILGHGPLISGKYSNLRIILLGCEDSTVLQPCVYVSSSCFLE